MIFAFMIMGINADAQPGIWARNTMPPLTYTCKQDSCLGSTATNKVLINLSGTGILKQITIDGVTDATPQHYIRLTLDGTVYEDSTSAAATTLHYLVLDITPSATTTEDAFVLSQTQKDLDISFNSNCKVEFRTDGSSTMAIKIDYLYEY